MFCLFLNMPVFSNAHIINPRWHIGGKPKCQLTVVWDSILQMRESSQRLLAMRLTHWHDVQNNKRTSRSQIIRPSYSVA